MKNSISTLMYTLPLLLFIISCGESEQKQEEGLEGHRSVLLPKNGMKMFVPNNYINVTVKEYRDFINSYADTTDKLTQMNVRSLELAHPISDYVAIYLDTTDVYNRIIFNSLESYIAISKYSAEQYLKDTEELLNKLWKDLGLNSSLLESKYASGKDVQMLQLKYELYYKGESQFFTHYAISSRNKTFFISFNNVEEKDYQYLINKIQL